MRSVAAPLSSTTNSKPSPKASNTRLRARHEQLRRIRVEAGGAEAALDIRGADNLDHQLAAGERHVNRPLFAPVYPAVGADVSCQHVGRHRYWCLLETVTVQWSLLHSQIDSSISVSAASAMFAVKPHGFAYAPGSV